MIRSTILRELVQSLDKVIFLLKHSVKLRRCILCDVAACRETVCVLLAGSVQAPWGWSKTETCSSDIYVYFNVKF